MVWWERALCMADITVPAWSRETLCAAIRNTREHSFGVSRVSIMDTRGGQRGQFHFRCRAAEPPETDYLAPFMEKAREAGVRVFAALDVYRLESGFAGRHRDWLQHRFDGAPVDDVRARGGAACPNNTQFRAWSLQVIRDLARYEVDGIFLDGPAFSRYGCWCPSCAERFRRRVDKDLPAREDWDDAAWKEFIEFRYDSVAEYVQVARAALRKTRPDTVFVTRGPVGEPGWACGRDTRRLSEHHDLAYADSGPGMAGGLWAHTLATKHLCAVSPGKPAAVGVPGTAGRWVHAPSLPAEVRLGYAQVIANGASPLYLAHTQSAPLACEHVAGEMNEFVKRNARYLEGSCSAADVALLWSERTADYYHSTVPVAEYTPRGERSTRKRRCGDHTRAVEGWADCLTRHHQQFDLADERTLEEGLDRYRVLVLPNVACFSQAHAGAIAAWVHAGGTLVSTFETSQYTDWGVRRSTPALRDVLGFEPSGVEGPRECDYFDRAPDPLFQDVTSPLLPSPLYRTTVTLWGPGARAVAWYRERLSTPYHPLPPVSKRPAIVENSYGAGSSLYFAGTFDESYLDHHHPDLGSIMISRVLSVSHPLVRPVACTCASGSIQVVVRRQREKRRLLIHLINATGEMVRPVRAVVPVERLRLEVPCLKSLGTARYMTPTGSTTQVLTPRWLRSGGAEIAIPRLHEYGLLVLEGVVTRS